MSGFNLPPGCSVSDLPGNSKADQEAELLADSVYALFESVNVTMSDAALDKVIEWVSKLQSDAFADGYSMGAADERMAQDYKDWDEMTKDK